MEPKESEMYIKKKFKKIQAVLKAKSNSQLKII